MFFFLVAALAKRLTLAYCEGFSSRAPFDKVVQAATLPEFSASVGVMRRRDFIKGLVGISWCCTARHAYLQKCR